MTGGIIMAGVPGNAWRTPARGSHPQIPPLIPIGAAAAAGVGGVSMAGLSTAAAWTTVGGGALFAGYQAAKFLDAQPKTGPKQNRGPSVPGGRSGWPRQDSLSQYAYGRRLPPGTTRKPLPQPQPQRVPPRGPKIAPPKVGCKVPSEYEPPEPELKSAYEPRHQGKLGQDDPQTFLSHGARPGEPAPQYHYLEAPEPDLEPPEPEADEPVDCNPRVQAGPGREMSP